MRILVLDTCLAVCQAAVFENGRVLAHASELMARGHQERLAPMAREVMTEAHLRFETLDRIAVTAGPGSFTGLRVGMAFAKGLAMALDRPCAGVGTLVALAASAETDGRRMAAIDAGRGSIYLQIFDGPEPLCAPDILPLETVAARLIEMGAISYLIGPQASRLAEVLPGVRPVEFAAPAVGAIARLAADAPATPPRPLYLRAPDAKIGAKVASR